jgi:hypothetical protein
MQLKLINFERIFVICEVDHLFICILICMVSILRAVQEFDAINEELVSPIIGFHALLINFNLD